MTANPLTNVAPFLTSVCPGYTDLEENIHHSLQLFSIPAASSKINWPLNHNSKGHITSTNLELDLTYLNIARPPLAKVESNTYVSLPLHVVEEFKKRIKTCDRVQEGNIHIGANISPLLQDPFRNVSLNPGSIAQVLELQNIKFLSNNPFATVESVSKGVVCDKFPGFQDIHNSLDIRVLAYNKDVFDRCQKLVITSHVNVLNVLGLDKESKYANTKHYKQVDMSGNVAETSVEVPLLRLQFDESTIITSMHAFVLHKEPIIAIGLLSGNIVVIEPRTAKFRKFDLGLNNIAGALEVICVSSLSVICHPQYDFLIVAGYSNGEAVIINPLGSSDSTLCVKKDRSVVIRDTHGIFFKVTDLSAPALQKQTATILFHFKLSHHPITAITSTLEIQNKAAGGATRDKVAKGGEGEPSNQPHIIAFASADGFVKFLDLMFSYGYDDAERIVSDHTIITDIISTYFNTSVTDVAFSPDYKFFCMLGKGDLIELFKLAYYNVDGVYKNKNRPSSGRSRSGTISSGYRRQSDAGAALASEVTELFPPMIKSMQIVCRFKAHTSSIKSLRFYTEQCASPLGTYRILSCGNDGRIILWEFDHKAIPKIKKPTTSNQISNQRGREPRRSIHERRPGASPMATTSLTAATTAGGGTTTIIAHSPSPIRHPRSSHRRNKSEDPIFKNPSLTNLLSVQNMNLNSVLSNGEQQQQEKDLQQQTEDIVALYRKLQNLRNRKNPQRYHQQYGTIIAPIVNDKLVPTIGIPLVTIDLSSLIPNGKIDSVEVDQNALFCFCKNGDIFRYSIV